MAYALRYLITLCGCLGVSVFAFAQPAAPAAPARAVRFTVFAARPVADLAFSPRADAAPQELVFYPTARSPQYEFRGAMPLRFVDATTGSIVAEANIPSGIREAFLLFLPIEASASSDGAGSAGALRYRIAVLDDGAARHGAGALAIVNLSGLALGGTVDKEVVTLKPGLNPTLAIGRSATVALNTVAKNRSYRAYTGAVTLARGERALLVLFPPFYKGAFEVQARLLIDRPESPATPAK